MSRRNRTLIVLAILAVAAVVAFVTRAWWLLLAIGVGVASPVVTLPVQRYYRRAGVTGRRVLIAAGVLLCLGVMALYVWGMALPALQSGELGGTEAWLFWIVWALIVAVPVVLLVMLVRAWRRAGDRARRPT